MQSDVGSFLRLLCLTEDMRTDPPDISSLLRLNGCDIRQSLLQLQFWTRSDGGRRVTRALTPTRRHGEEMSSWNHSCLLYLFIFVLYSFLLLKALCSCVRKGKLLI